MCVYWEYKYRVYIVNAKYCSGNSWPHANIFKLLNYQACKEKETVFKSLNFKLSKCTYLWCMLAISMASINTMFGEHAFILVKLFDWRHTYQNCLFHFVIWQQIALYTHSWIVLKLTNCSSFRSLHTWWLHTKNFKGNLFDTIYDNAILNKWYDYDDDDFISCAVNKIVNDDLATQRSRYQQRRDPDTMISAACRR